MLAQVRKALVPLILSGVVVVAEALGVKLPGDVAQQIAAGITTAIFVYLVPNG